MAKTTPEFPAHFDLGAFLSRESHDLRPRSTISWDSRELSSRSRGSPDGFPTRGFDNRL